MANLLTVCEKWWNIWKEESSVWMSQYQPEEILRKGGKVNSFFFLFSFFLSYFLSLNIQINTDLSPTTRSPFRLSNYIFVRIYRLSQAMNHTSPPPWFGHLHNIWRAQIMTQLIWSNLLKRTVLGPHNLLNTSQTTSNNVLPLMCKTTDKVTVQCFKQKREKSLNKLLRTQKSIVCEDISHILLTHLTNDGVTSK
jgi:hypothetical protein